MVEAEERLAMMQQQPQLDQVVTMLDTAKEMLEPRSQQHQQPGNNVSMQTEIRTLEFWRAIIAECIATFFYVSMICSAHSATSDQDSAAAVQVFTAVGTGLAMATLHHAFAPVSGGHLNPAVTAAAVVTKRVSLLRAALYVCAQCGGAIAGAALVYGIYGARDQFESVAVSSFGLEFILTFIVVFVFFSVSSPPRAAAPAAAADPSLTIGLAYMAALSCYKGALNPARALGPAFVANKFSLHWVFWAGPVLGGVCGAFCFQFIFNVRGGGAGPRLRAKDVEAMSVRSEEDMIDDLERVKQYRASILQHSYSDHRGGSGGGGGGQSLYSSSLKQPGYKRPLDVDSVYGGTKSLYNGDLGRSQARLDRQQFDCSKSVYAGEMEAVGPRGHGGHGPPPHQLRTSLKRSQSSHAAKLRRPDDPLPYAAGHDKGAPGGHSGHRYAAAESYAADPHYSDYIRRKNAAADQCSGSSSGYYSSGKEAELERRLGGAQEAGPGYPDPDTADKARMASLGRARGRSVSREPAEYGDHRRGRDRSLGHGGGHGERGTLRGRGQQQHQPPPLNTSNHGSHQSTGY